MKGVLSACLIAALLVVLWSGAWFSKGYSGGNYEGYAAIVIGQVLLAAAGVALVCCAVLVVKFRVRWAMAVTLAAGPLVLVGGRLMKLEHEWNAHGAREQRERTAFLAEHPVARAVDAGDMDALTRAMTSATREEIDAPDDEGVAAIHLAAQRGYLEMARMLLDKGATQSTSRSGTPVDFAVRLEHLDVAEFLVEQGGQPTEIEVVSRILWWKPELIDRATLDPITTEGAILYVILGQAGRHDSVALAHLSRFPFNPDAVPRLSKKVEPVNRTLLGYALQQVSGSAAENPDERKRAMLNLQWLLAHKADPNRPVEGAGQPLPLRYLLAGQTTLGSPRRGMRDWGDVEDTFSVIRDLLSRGARIDDRIERPARPQEACSTTALFLSGFHFAVALALEKAERNPARTPPTPDQLERLGASAPTSVVDGFLTLLELFAERGGKTVALDSCVRAIHGSSPSAALSEIEAFLPVRQRPRCHTLLESMK